jgi:branched-chain amino acid transport system permease protein
MILRDHSVTKQWAWPQILAVAALVVSAILLPVFGDRQVLGIAIIVLMYIALGESWNLLSGMAGLFSITHCVFFGLGVYGVSISVSKLGLPLYVGILAGLLLNAALSAIIGLIVSKLSGIYFVMAQIGLWSTVATAAIQFFALTGGSPGITLPREYYLPQPILYLIILGIAIFSIAVFIFIRRSRMGTILVAIKENENLSLSLGVNVGKWKLLAVVCSACMASLAGSFYSLYVMSNNPDVFSFLISLKIIMVVIVGGIGSVWGPLFGSLLIVFDEVIRGLMPTKLAPFSVIIYALVLIVMALRHPEGLVSIGRSLVLKVTPKK